ncbi:transporter [Halosquirtibacter laminarini]|uniref:Transporter n=1 Tax=Halosquirtibacter laminarini TaxID=3374600 RepID=A0AC61NHD6_9BACT|nr:transporter [Prolixibacteraceae bacterium]
MATAQEHSNSHQHEEEGRHSLALYTGFTHNAGSYFSEETKEKSTGRWVPTIGLDYYYTLNHKWDIGAMTDLELEEYYVDEEEGARTYERTNAWAFIAVAKYKPIEGLGIFFGPGIEFEFKKDIKTESLFVAKIGVEYEVPIKNGWAIAPSLIYDYKYSKDLKFSAFSYGFSIGKRF